MDRNLNGWITRCFTTELHVFGLVEKVDIISSKLTVSCI